MRINFSGGAPPAGDRPQRGGFNAAPRFNAGGDGGEGGESNTLFVGNLGFKTHEGTIRSFFSDCGEISAVRIALNEEGRAKGFAHVQFESPAAAKKALE